jgi:TIR domain-containing protein
MATRRITIRTQVRVQVRRTVRWRQTFTPIYQPPPAIPTRTVAQLAPTSQHRRVISTSGGTGGLDDLYVAPPSPERDWDVFVSYSGEDRATASELTNALEALDIRAWFAKTELTIGMGLRRSIDYGLGHSRFGVVLMSHSFFGREWPQRELDGIVALQVGGRQRVLPIWHGISHDDMLRYSPTLADTVAARTSDSTIEEIAAEIARVVREA